MTIKETKIGPGGEVVSQRELGIGSPIDFGTDPGVSIAVVMPELGIGVSLDLPPSRMTGRVLSRDAESGRDRLRMPDGRELIGNQINREDIRLPSTEQGVVEVKLSSTRNPRPRRRSSKRR